MVFLLINQLGKNGKLSKEDKLKIKKKFEKNHIDENNLCYGQYKGKNLIVLQIEALQNFAIDLKVDGKEVTPNLNKFVKRSLYFSNYYAQIGGGNTSDAEFAVNNSMYLMQGSAYFRYQNNDYSSIGKLLGR